jgi:hypothetical protein
MLYRKSSLLNILAIVFIAVVLAVVVAGGCTGVTLSPSPLDTTAAGGEARIIVTRNFGCELMFDEVIRLEGDTSAMEALGQVAEIDTSYGGGFVDAIKGVSSQYLKSGGREDWFVYLNGIQSDVGALDYTLCPGDVEHWDFRDWSFHHFIPAIIGDFPEPFLHGYGGEVRPVLVVYQDNLEEEAETVADHLCRFGVAEPAITDFSHLNDGDRKACNIILLGDMDYEPVAELNTVWKRLGFYAGFEEGKLLVFDYKGKLAAEYGAGSGLIQATQNPWNPRGIGVCENVVWMLSGVDEAGVKRAVDALVSHYHDFQYACAAVITDGEIAKIPPVEALD